jgi:DNA-binding NarL/FixJ family response regulator
VIADDTALLRHGMVRLLSEQGVEVCGEAADAAELMRLVEDERPDVALVDIRMPPTHTDEGLVAAAQIRAGFPEVGVLVLSQYVEPAYVLRLLDGDEGGRCGYLLKDRVLEVADLVISLERIASGEVVIDPELVSTMLARRREVDPLDGLTDREREVLALMAEGLSDKGIAERLWVTRKTVEAHVRHILRKLTVSADASHNRRVAAVITYLRA